MQAAIVAVLSCVAAGSPALGQARVIITEIMYNPGSKETRGETEWVEIANVGDAAIEIKGWRLDDEDERRGDDWGSFSCRLEPGGVAVLVNELTVTEAAFREAWDVEDDSLGELRYLVIPVKWGSISNQPTAENEILQLLDGESKVVCEVNLESGGDWPKLTPKGGPSIWLTDITAKDLNVGRLWKKSDADKEGARRNVKTDVFEGEDVGSPGYVPGLKDTGGSSAGATPKASEDRKASPGASESTNEPPIDY